MCIIHRVGTFRQRDRDSHIVVSSIPIHAVRSNLRITPHIAAPTWYQVSEYRLELDHKSSLGLPFPFTGSWISTTGGVDGVYCRSELTALGHSAPGVQLPQPGESPVTKFAPAEAHCQTHPKKAYTLSGPYLLKSLVPSTLYILFSSLPIFPGLPTRPSCTSSPRIGWPFSPQKCLSPLLGP